MSLHEIRPKILLSVAQQNKSGLGRLGFEVSRPPLPHTDTHTHTHTHTHTAGMTPLNERSARRTDRYLHNTCPQREAIKWLQTYGLDRTATGMGQYYVQ